MRMVKIKSMSEDEYLMLKATGMFWVLYPEATGCYNADKKLSQQNKFKIEQ